MFERAVLRRQRHSAGYHRGDQIALLVHEIENDGQYMNDNKPEENVEDLSVQCCKLPAKVKSDQVREWSRLYAINIDGKKTESYLKQH